MADLTKDTFMTQLKRLQVVIAAEAEKSRPKPGEPVGNLRRAVELGQATSSFATVIKLVEAGELAFDVE